MDGKTSGPNALSGEIGNTLKAFVDLKVVKFTPINTGLPIIDVELSTDQKYLYDICTAAPYDWANVTVTQSSTG